MMSQSTWLYSVAVFVALAHTVLGPDHYVPFVAMARAGQWSRRKTVAVTALCGLGHVLGSIVLGLLGLGLGLGVGRLESWEAFRGDLAGWMLLAFGLAYTAWGIRRAVRNRPHIHLHVHSDGTIHSHGHTHHAEHLHVHSSMPPPFPRGDQGGSIDADAYVPSPRYGPWVLFTFFLFGPCEPLIPLLMYPAAKNNLFAVAVVTALFAATTIATMVAIVLVGVGWVPFRLPAGFARLGHAVAGLAITLCGAAVQLGL